MSVLFFFLEEDIDIAGAEYAFFLTHFGLLPSTSVDHTSQG